MEPEPTAFAFGKATNRAEYAVASFEPGLPVIGPVLALKPTNKQPQRPAEGEGRGLAMKAAFLVVMVLCAGALGTFVAFT